MSVWLVSFAIGLILGIALAAPGRPPKRQDEALDQFIASKLEESRLLNARLREENQAIERRRAMRRRWSPEYEAQIIAGFEDVSVDPRIGGWPYRK